MELLTIRVAVSLASLTSTFIFSIGIKSSIFLDETTGSMDQLLHSGKRGKSLNYPVLDTGQIVLGDALQVI